MNPVHDPDAETQVLGAAMHSPEVLDECATLRPEDFYRPEHEHLWRVLIRQHTAGAPTEPTAVLDALKRDPMRGLDAARLHTIHSSLVTAASAAYYAEIIALKARARRMAAVGQRITQIALAADTTATDLDVAAENAQAELATVDRPIDAAGFIGDRLDETIDALDKPAPTIPTPWPSLNHIIGGWAPGRLYVIGARPGVGKSVLGVQAAVHMAQSGKVAAVVSLEMSRQDLDYRVIAQIGQVPYGRLDARKLEERDWQKVAAVTGTLAELPLAVNDDSNMTVHQIRAWVRSLARRREIGMVVVDYLQLMEGPSKMPRHEVVGGFSRALKLLAKELAVPVIALSQLNRASEQRTNKVPSLADLRESGAVEQDSDVVVLLHRDLESRDQRDKLGVGVAKNRHGITEGFSLNFEGHYMRAVEPAWTPSRSVA